MKNLAIIPARSGSKGVKNKNIRELCGKPMLAYSVEAALKSGIYDEVMVSTDSEEYAEIGRKYGAEVPFLRSEKTSSDKASSWDAVREVLDMYHDLGKDFDMFTLLQPTSPLRTSKDIEGAYKLFNEKGANSVISVCELDHSPRWCNTLPEDLSMDGFISKLNNVQRQALETYYRLNGAVYMVKTSFFYEDMNIYREKSFAYIMPSYSSLDLDTEMDFKIAEAILKEIL